MTVEHITRMYCDCCGCPISEAEDRFRSVAVTVSNDKLSFRFSSCLGRDYCVACVTTGLRGGGEFAVYAMRPETAAPLVVKFAGVA